MINSQGYMFRNDILTPVQQHTTMYIFLDAHKSYTYIPALFDLLEQACDRDKQPPRGRCGGGILH